MEQKKKKNGYVVFKWNRNCLLSRLFLFLRVSYIEYYMKWTFFNIRNWFTLTRPTKTLNYFLRLNSAKNRLYITFG